MDPQDAIGLIIAILHPANNTILQCIQENGIYFCRTLGFVKQGILKSEPTVPPHWTFSIQVSQADIEHYR